MIERFDSPSLDLELSHRARSAVETLGLGTVRDVIATSEADVKAVPGCGTKTWQELQSAALTHVNTGGSAAPAQADLDRPLLELIRNPRAEKAFFTLGLTTVRDFVEADRDELLAVPGFGPKTYDTVLATVQSTLHDERSLCLTPDNLTSLPLDALRIPGRYRDILEALECRTVGDAFELPESLWGDDGPIGTEGAASVRDAIGEVVDCGLRNREMAPPPRDLDFPGLRSRLLGSLATQDAAFFCERVGFDRDSRTAAELAVSQGEPLDAILRREAAIREQVLHAAPLLISRFREELDRELEAFEGSVTGEHLASGTLGHTLAKSTGDARLPLRILQFLHPKDYHVHGDVLCALARSTFHNLLRRMRRLTESNRLPVSLATLEAELQPMRRGLLLHLLRSLCHLTVVIDPKEGEVVRACANSHSARLRTIFVEEARPLVIEDIVFHYRDRFGRANKGRLLTQLRRDKTFLEVGSNLWSLRSRHADELEIAHQESDRLAVSICANGGANRLHELAGEDTSERSLFLLIDCLKRNHSVRSLGRGRFCPSMTTQSQVMMELCQEFRRAMGEVPLEHFVRNHRPERQRLVRRLLLENRMFVLPEEDRVDVLTNYPFNEERMRRFLAFVGDELAESGGYATHESICAALAETDLGGSWLHPHLLDDLLRRHSDYELLPGGLIADVGSNLGGWIQARAREALRAVDAAVTVDHVLTEAPELAEFRTCLEQLMVDDPLIATPDGAHFRMA